jgi:hypothetical protein
MSEIGVDTTFEARDEIETEGLTVETVWSFKEGKYRTALLINWDVLLMYTGYPSGLSRMICHYWAVDEIEAKMTHERVLVDVYRGYYAVDLEMKIADLTPVDVQEDVSER